jgi:peptidyl-prolyl cis-trans isomerase A (cyclophilin A)
MKPTRLLLATLVAACLAATPALAQGTAPAAAQPTKSEPVKEAPKKEEMKKQEPKKEESKKEEPKKDDAKKDETKAAGGGVFIHMKTSMGDIYLELDGAKAPISTQNFCSFVDKRFYDGTIFHRVIPGFMIQGGGMTPDMKEKPTDKPIQNEWQNGLKNVRGTVAMARTGGGPDSPNSATSQFFINVVDNAFLDRPQPDGAAYAVFGKVIGGMDVVDKIKAVQTGSRSPHSNVPVTPVVIEQVSRIGKEEAEKATKK